MAAKPRFASGYPREHTELVRSTCLYVATKLGDLMQDLVIVGGLVPSLIINQERTPNVELHIGTMDLDLGLQLALLEEGRYRELTERLRDARFETDVNERGHPTKQRWVLEEGRAVTIDFLIPPTESGEGPGTLKHLEHDFAAVVVPGLRCAFRDRQRVTLEGRTPFAEKATRDVWVCGAGAFIVLKSLAFGNRGENKDAYDLFYVLRNYGNGVRDVVARLAPLLASSEGQEALRVLERDFIEQEHVGPRRVAEFTTGGPDEDVQADVVGFVTELLRLSGGG